MTNLLSGKFRQESVWSLLRRLHRDEQGAEMVEKLLLVGFIALPLLGFLIYFREDVSKWLNEFWTDIKGRPREPIFTP